MVELGHTPVVLGWAVDGGGLVVNQGAQIDDVVAHREVVVTHRGRVVVGITTVVGVDPAEVLPVLPFEVTDEPIEVVRVGPAGTGWPDRAGTEAVEVGTSIRVPPRVVAEK